MDRQATHRRLVARADLLRGQVARAGGDPETATKLLDVVTQTVGELGDQLLLRDAEMELGLAHAAAGRTETAMMHLGHAERLVKAIAGKLPSALAKIFTQARPQQALARALEAPLESGRPAAPRTRPALPTPTRARRPEWDERYAALIGQAPRLLKVFHILDRVAESDSTVLIQGESGTGKELIAQALHESSPRRAGPFVKLNCAALVESLLLSELFGHERGSFTGAHQRKVGRFEMAAGGTIFLDEIGDISPKTQVSLLRVLQEREFERVGGGRPIQLEARVVCATNRNLAQLVREGTFREDLYYRLKGITVELPPLRDRPEDIEALAGHFLTQLGSDGGQPRRLSDSAIRMLCRYGWPGNVRELENVIRSVALFADGPVIDRVDFDEYRELFEDSPAFEAARRAVQAVAETPPPDPTDPLGPRRLYAVPAPAEATEPAADPEAALLARIFDEGVSLADLKRRIQDEAISSALEKSQGNITKAAEMLGMKRPRLSQIINGSEALKALCQGVSR